MKPTCSATVAGVKPLVTTLPDDFEIADVATIKRHCEQLAAVFGEIGTADTGDQLRQIEKRSLAMPFSADEFAEICRQIGLRFAWLNAEALAEEMKPRWGNP